MAIETVEITVDMINESLSDKARAIVGEAVKITFVEDMSDDELEAFMNENGWILRDSVETYPIRAVFSGVEYSEEEFFGEGIRRNRAIIEDSMFVEFSNNLILNLRSEVLTNFNPHKLKINIHS